MAATIPDAVIDLFDRETYAILGTVMPDGTPHLTPVWIDHDGDDILVNTARGRQKDRNVRANPRVGVCILDPDDPYRYVSVLGRVITVTTDGADDHIDALARRYMDVEEYPHHGEERGPRVIIRIQPDRVTTST
ncbi:MAG: PPOX class F420-dependent oxidoreductase [Halobacteriaceae archaeon]